MSKDKYAGQFTGDVLKAALKVVVDDEFKVSINNLPAKGDRPQGVLIFVADMEFAGGEFKTMSEAVQS